MDRGRQHVKFLLQLLAAGDAIASENHLFFDLHPIPSHYATESLIRCQIKSQQSAEAHPIETQ